MPARPLKAKAHAADRDKDVRNAEPERSPEDAEKGAERALEHPLSFLPAGRRGAVAQERIVEHIVQLMNVTLEAATHSEGEARQTRLVMLNVEQALLAIAREKAVDEVARRALYEFERGALKVIRALTPDEPPAAPSAHFELDDHVLTLTGSKLALLDTVSKALKERVSPSEQAEDGRLNIRELNRVVGATSEPDDDTATRARQVAAAIMGALLEGTEYAKLLVHPANPNNYVQDLARLTRIIRQLMLNGQATVPQVARAVLFAFGQGPSKLKNMFSAELLEIWEEGHRHASGMK